jgi:uncharacterized protein (DUF1778 family)
MMAEKISVYVDEKLHRILKAEAAQRGKSLSQFMIDAAVNSLHTPDRKKLAAAMDTVREAQEEYYTREELLQMRKDGRRY